jgi:hypothetical protein
MSNRMIIVQMLKTTVIIHPQTKKKNTFCSNTFLNKLQNQRKLLLYLLTFNFRLKNWIDFKS